MAATQCNSGDQAHRQDGHRQLQHRPAEKLSTPRDPVRPAPENAGNFTLVERTRSPKCWVGSLLMVQDVWVNRDEMRRLALGWGEVASEYADELFDELDAKPGDRALLQRFADLVDPAAGDVLDIGCGPGHVTDHLVGLGLRAVGMDISPEMIEIARVRTPRAEFQVGDMARLELPSGSLGGAVAMYSLINVVREDIAAVLSGLGRAICPAGPLLVATHQGEGTLHVEELFGLPVPMAATLFGLEEMCTLVEAAGFDVVVAESRAPLPNEAPTQRLYVLATNSAAASDRGARSAPTHSNDYR